MFQFNLDDINKRAMKTFKSIVILCFLSFFNQIYGQSIKKDKGHVNDKTFSYYYMQPQLKVAGIVILLPATGEKPQSIFNKTSLPKLLAEKGYLTIIPEVHNLLYADQYNLDILDQLFHSQSEKYKISTFIIGGLSSGGALAARYGEYLLAKDTVIMLKGIIVIDAPLDLKRIYTSAERMINFTCNGIIKKEGYSNKTQLEQALGGSPAAQPKQYLKYSSYSASEENGGNARFLKNIPIRLYSEPDLDFVRKTYCADFQLEDLNATDLENLNKFLLKIGNTQSQYITTKGKGFHSWNIVDPINCRDWILSISH